MAGPELRLDHIALLVRDLEESVAFYTALPGISEIANPMGGTEIRWLEYASGQRLHLQAGDIAAVHMEKQTHFAFSIRDFDGALRALKAAGLVYGDFRGLENAINVRPDGLRAVFLRDPNGYWIEINDGGRPA